MTTTCRASDTLPAYTWMHGHGAPVLVVGDLEQLLRHHGVGARNAAKPTNVVEIDLEEQAMILERAAAWRERVQHLWSKNAR